MVSKNFQPLFILWNQLMNFGILLNTHDNIVPPLVSLSPLVSRK